MSASPVRGLNLKLAKAQTAGILQIEIGRTLRSGRIWFVVLLAGLPVLLFALRLLVGPHHEAHHYSEVGGHSGMYAILFQSFFIRILVFFGCVALFMNTFRGEIAEKTLHYYLLCPVRRDVLAAGKFLSGWIIAAAAFCLSAALSYLLIFASPPGILQSFVLEGPGKWHLLAYVAITAMACAGYGALFLLLGLFFRNPILPAAVVLGWESINFLLPPVLKKISVVYYLDSLSPVPIPIGAIAILSDPAPAWLAFSGLLALTTVAFAAAAWRLKNTEIAYSE